MKNPIIIKKEITDFLEAQNFHKILSKLSNDITFTNRVEVWLKDSFFVTIETSLKSDLVTHLLCYKAGAEVEDSFNFFDSTRASIGIFFAKVREYPGEEVSQFPATVWKPYCKVFVTKDSYGKELEDAKNLLQELQQLDSSVRDKFCGVEEVLHTILGESLSSEIPFQEGDLIQNERGDLYRFCGDKNEVGAYLVNDSTMNRYLDCEALKQCEKIEVFPALEETLKRFYVFFDSEFINKVLKPATEVLGWEPIDSATIAHNCELFQPWVQEKKRLFLKNEGVFGLRFYFKVTNQLRVEGNMDSSLCYLHLKIKNLDNDGDYSREFFNPFLQGKRYFSRTVDQILEMLSSIYETFNPEIREQNLTVAFIDIYSMWEQIQSTVKDLSEETNATLQEKVLELFGKEKKDSPAEEKVGSSGMQSLRAFDDDFGNPFQQKTETRIKMEDTMPSVLFKMSEGNPGAMTALSSLMKHPELVKPADPFMEILALDSLHLYGSKLYDFLIYCCENSIKNLRLVSLNHSYGNLSEEIIHEFVENLTPFFPNKDNDENLKNFKDWSAFKDCYPEEEDVPFDPNKKYHTWGELAGTTASQPVDKTSTETDKQVSKRTKKKSPTWSSFIADAFLLGFEVGWSKKSPKEPQEILLFRTDGLVLYACESAKHVSHAVVYGEIPFNQKDNIGKAGGAGTEGGKFSFVKNVRTGLKKLSNELESVELSAVWTIKHPGLVLITPEEKKEFTVDEKTDMKQAETLTKQKLSECCDKMKQIVAKNLEAKSLFSK